MVQQHSAYSRALKLAAAAAGILLVTTACSEPSDDNETATPVKKDSAIVSAAKAAGFDFEGVDGLAETTVDVGQLLALTGPGAFFGEVMGNGSKLAAEQIREAGGPNIVFKAADNKTGSPDASVAGARRLIAQDHVDLLQSSFGASTLALIPLIEQNKMLTFQAAGATSDQLSQSDYLWMARATATDSYPAFADYAKQENPDATTAMVIVGNDSSSLAAAEPVKDRWEELGGTVLGQETVTAGATDVGPQVAKIKSENPDVVFMVLFGGDYSTALKALRDAGVDAPIVGSDWSTEGHTATGDADEGYAYQVDAFDPTADDPFVQMFVKGYKDEFGSDPEPYGASFYENTWQIAELVKRVVEAGEDVTSENILAALKDDPSMPWSLTCNKVTWDVDTKAELGKPQAMSVIKDGASERVGLVYGDKLEMGADLSC